jgi:hypothetical protein
MSPRRHVNAAQGCRKEADVFLQTMQTKLWRELCGSQNQAIFARKKVIDLSISQFETVGNSWSSSTFGGQSHGLHSSICCAP